MPGKSERQMLKKQMQIAAAAAHRDSSFTGLPPLPGQLTGGSGGYPSSPDHLSLDSPQTNSIPRIIKFGSMPSYREDKMMEMKQQQQQTSKLPPPPPPPFPSMSLSGQTSTGTNTPNTAPSTTQHHLYLTKDNRKDSATSPVDPALMDQDDELLLIDERTAAAAGASTPHRFIELSPNNLSKLSLKDKQHQQRWTSILSQTLPFGASLDLSGGPAAMLDQVSAAAGASQTSIMTPLLAQEETLRHSRHSLHRQSSQGTGEPASPGSESPLTEVERTLKSLNGYHEDILEALQTAAAQQQRQVRVVTTGSGSALNAAGSNVVSDSDGVGVGVGVGVNGRQSSVSTQEAMKKAMFDTDYGGKF